MHAKQHLSRTVQRYFDAWIMPKTWHTRHDCDMERFYQFVKAVKRYNRRAPSDALVGSLIQQRGAETVDNRFYLDKRARQFAALYARLLDYEKTSFPDPLTEKNNILRFHNALIARYGHDRKEEIAAIMTAEWGKDWMDQRRIAMGQ